MAGIPTHTHVSDYADPVLRPPSPASSLGTAYGADQTSYSDSEYQLSQVAFERKVNETIELHLPRKEELEADQDPLLTVLGPNGRPMRIRDKKLEPEEEKILYDHCMDSLRAAVAQVREDQLFEQILLRGSKAALEVQPTTNDIDSLMQSMMSSNISSGPHMGKAAVPNPSRPTAKTGPGITNGPWNNFGQPSESERSHSTFLSNGNMLSGTTVGKRSRNGSSRKA